MCPAQICVLRFSMPLFSRKAILSRTFISSRNLHPFSYTQASSRTVCEWFVAKNGEGGGGYSFHAQSASYETWGCISKRDTCRAGVSVACSIDYCVHANKENALHAYQAVRCVGALFLVVLRHMCIAYRKVVARC